MELESDDDDLILANKHRPQLVQLDDVMGETRDTQPIIMVSQADLSERQRKRRTKLNVIAIVGIMSAFLVALAVSIYMVIHFAVI